MNLEALQLAEQVIERCGLLATYSEEPDRLTRRYLTEPMHAVHRSLQEWMRESRLVSRIDDAGNCIGRYPSKQGERAVLLGSHLDSVPGGGRFDGVLGVMIALAVASRLADRELPFHVDVLGLSEEEGVRFRMPYLGSSALAGQFRDEWLNRQDEAGVTMREAIEQFHLDPSRIARCAYDCEEVIAYIEPHLEQGPVLDQLALPVGVVTGIAGQCRLRVIFQGEAGHAGTTPMEGRRDALVAAARFIDRVNAKALEVKGLRATVGNVSVTPNTPNVIPGRVEVSLDVRHVDDAVRRAAIDDTLATALRCGEDIDCQCTVLEESTQNAKMMDPTLRSLLCETLVDQGLEPFLLPSGAGHDAVVMGTAFPIAMLFLRHPGGMSHCPDERCRTEDVAVAIEVLTQYVLRLAESDVPFTRTDNA